MNHKTRHSLLNRACDAKDSKAWDEFVEVYRRFIVYILQQVGVAENDIEDVTQQILISLTDNLPTYDRTQSQFRTWFGAVIRNRAFSYLRSKKRQSFYLDRLEQEVRIDAPSKGRPDLDLLIEDEWETYVANLAFDRVREVFEGQAIKVFELNLDGASVDEIVRQTDLTIASVYTLKKRVKKRLYLEIRTIIEELEP